MYMSISIEKKLCDEFLVLYQNRYCDQEDFSIAVYCGENGSKNELYDKPFTLNNFCTKICLPNLIKTENECKAIASGSDIYVTDKYQVSYSHSVKLYFSSTKRWKILPSLNKV